MALASKRTQEFDRLLVRDLQLRDARNNPYPAGKVLLSDGRGGTYFGDFFGASAVVGEEAPVLALASTPPAFNEVRIMAENGLDTELSVPARDPSNNVLRLGSAPGSGVGWYTETPPGAAGPTLFAYTTDIKAIRVQGGGAVSGNRTIYGSRLTDGLLNFVPAGDTQIEVVGDNTLRFTTRSASTAEDLRASLDATTQLLSTSVGVADLVNETVSTVTTYLTDTGINRLIESLNTVIQHPDAAPQLTASSVVTSTLSLGGALLSHAQGVVRDPDARRTNLSTSAHVSLLSFGNGAFTGTRPALYQERSQQATSLQGGSTDYVTTQQTAAFGWVPTLSTNASYTKAGFVPVFEQVERARTERVLSLGGVERLMECSTLHRAYLDEVCAPTAGGLLLSTPTLVVGEASNGVAVRQARDASGRLGEWGLGPAVGAPLLTFGRGGGALSVSTGSVSSLRASEVRVEDLLFAVSSATFGAALGVGLRLWTSDASGGGEETAAWCLQDASSGAVLLRCADGGADAGGRLTVSTVMADVVEGNLFSVSDGRLKTNVQPVRNALSTLAHLRPCLYEWREGASMRPGLPELGFIAQNLDAHVPHIIRVRPGSEATGGRSVGGGESTLTVAYDRLTALLTAGVQEQQSSIDSLESNAAVAEVRLAEMEARGGEVAALQAQVAQLSAQVQLLTAAALGLGGVRQQPSPPPPWAASIWASPTHQGSAERACLPSFLLA